MEDEKIQDEKIKVENIDEDNQDQNIQDESAIDTEKQEEDVPPKPMGKWEYFLTGLKIHWKPLFAVLGPIILLPLILVDHGLHTNKLIAHGAYGTIIVISYWTTEALPLPVSSFMPAFVFPFLGVGSSHEFVNRYFNDSVMVFLAGLLIALAFEFSNLHKRIALKVIVTIGASPRRLLLGVMLTTSFLSMWMSNTAIAAMMIPIVMAIMSELETLLYQTLEEQIDAENPVSRLSMLVTNTSTKTSISLDHAAKLRSLSVPRPPKQSVFGTDATLAVIPGPGVVEEPEKPKRPFKSRLSPPSLTSLIEMSPSVQKRVEGLNKVVVNLRKMFLMSIAYSANLGGTAMITGSGTNFVARNEFEVKKVTPFCDGPRAKLGFVEWMIFNSLPFTLGMVFSYIFLMFWYKQCDVRLFSKFKKNKTKENSVSDDPAAFKITPEIVQSIRTTLQKSYANLGHFSVHEICVLAVFLVTVLVWILHDPDVIPGWASLFSTHPTLATAGIVFSISLFIIPRTAKFYKALRKCNFEKVRLETLLDWRTAQERFPWGVVLVLGGGFALSQGVTLSGLGSQVGIWLKPLLEKMSRETMLITVIYLTSFTTQVASNTAVSSILVPVLLDISRKLSIHPMFLALPATVASSYAFMLPVATPPNAIVFAAGHMKVLDMLIPGVFMNIVTGAILFICTLSWGKITYNFDTYVFNTVCASPSTG